MSDMKTYRGKIKSLQLYRTSAFGVRMWKVGFRTGTAYFYIGMKQQMPFLLGDTICFKGEFIGEIHRFFQITQVVDVNDAVNSQEEFNKIAVQTEQEVTEMMSYFLVQES